MKIAILQINTTIGDFAGNRQRILDRYREAVSAGSDLVLAPELVTCGYPPRDLLYYSDFIKACTESSEVICSETGSVPLVFGTVEPRMSSTGKPLYNAAWVAHCGEVVHRIHKSLLPTYDVFDEDRYFEPGTNSSVWEYQGRRIGITVCEDIWNDPDYWPERLYNKDPVATLQKQGMDILLNVSASPWWSGKESVRQDMLGQLASKLQIPVLQANAVGGNDELVFDGHSLSLGADGKLRARGRGFEEGVVFDEIDRAPHLPGFSDPPIEQLWKALCLGTADYVRKCGFSRVVIGLSGGIDSAVTAAIASDALGPENVLGVTMPSEISSTGSVDDSVALAGNFGFPLHRVPIGPAYDVLNETLAPVFENAPRDVTEENIQARIRGLLLMAISNKSGRLVLTTGNKSELAAGYCTLYGDMCGGLAVINDVPKTKVYELARFRNRDGEMIPVSTIEKPPSAELSPGQKDEDSLPPYDQLDAILEGYIVHNKTVGGLVKEGHDAALVREWILKVDVNEYKRRQAAPGLKVTSRAFGVGRRVPIAQQFRHP